MTTTLIQLLVLAGIAVFLILKLRAVLGTREGFEKPPIQLEELRKQTQGRTLEVIEGGADRDIVDHVPAGSDMARALAAMKEADPAFTVTPFLNGSRRAYEMILMAFEKGDLEPVRDFISPEVAGAFEEVIAARKAKGLVVEATFVGLKELAIEDATFSPADRTAEITVRFVAELTSAVYDASGQLVEGDPRAVKRQRDVWTFARRMGNPDPNWQLVATGD